MLFPSYISQCSGVSASVVSVFFHNVSTLLLVLLFLIWSSLNDFPVLHRIQNSVKNVRVFLSANVSERMSKRFSSGSDFCHRFLFSLFPFSSIWVFPFYIFSCFIVDAGGFKAIFVMIIVPVCPCYICSRENNASQWLKKAALERTAKYLRLYFSPEMETLWK